MKKQITKAEKLGYAERIEALRTDPKTGGLRDARKIEKLLEAQGIEDCGYKTIKAYLEKIDAQRKPYAEQAIKEAVVPHAISTMEILTNLEQQLYNKVRATGEDADKLIPCATGARALLDVIKTKMGLLGIKLADPDRPDDDLRTELATLRQRAEGTGAAPRNGSTGTAATPRLPN